MADDKLYEARLYRRPDSPVWWCWFYDKRGRRIRASTRHTEKRAAIAALRRFEIDAESLPTHSYTMGEALDDFLRLGTEGIAPATRLMYEQKAKHLRDFFSDRDLSLLGFDHVMEYISARREATTAKSEDGARTSKPVATETLKKELVTLRRALRLAFTRGKVTQDLRVILPTLKSDYVPRDRWLTAKEYLALLGELRRFREDDLRCQFVRVAVYTGARKGELERLERHHVQGEWILIPGSKTGRARRQIPIEKPLARVLGHLPKKGPLLAPWEHVDRDLPRACARAGIARATCNDLRRTFASWMLQKGVPVFDVARLLGHTSTAMVERVYGHLAAHNLVAAVRALPDPERGRVTKA